MKTKRWFRKSLGDAMLVATALDEVNKAFQSEYEKAACPPEMALFIRHESEGRLHCELVVYLSPACEAIANAIAALPCRIPYPNDLSLSAGSEACWPLLFSAYSRRKQVLE